MALAQGTLAKRSLSKICFTETGQFKQQQWRLPHPGPLLTPTFRNRRENQLINVGSEQRVKVFSALTLTPGQWGCCGPSGGDFAPPGLDPPCEGRDGPGFQSFVKISQLVTQLKSITNIKFCLLKESHVLRARQLLGQSLYRYPSPWSATQTGCKYKGNVGVTDALA